MNHGKTFTGAYSPHGEEARPHRKCVVCTRKGQRKETQYWGSIVFKGCFKVYHILLNF
jgi:hypothetical protein